METETTTEGVGETTEGEMKNCVNMVAKKEAEESNSKATIKENGTSDHSEIKQDLEIAAGNDSSNNLQSQNTMDEDGLSENDELNKDDYLNVNENGDIASNDTGATNGNNEGEETDLRIQNKVETSENDILDSDSMNDTGLDKVDNNFSENEEDSKLESVENSEESQDSITDEKKETPKATEKSDPSGIPGLASEDSSKDSTDSSISDAGSVKKEDNSVNDSAEKNEVADIGHVMNSSEKDLKEEETNDCDSKSQSVKTDEMEVNDDKIESEKDEEKKSSENSSEDINDKVKDEEMEVDDKNKSGDNKENKTSEKNSDTVVKDVANANVKPPILSQPTSSYMIPVSSVPYVISQQPMTVHQQQTGYITKVGNQHIFVPVPGSGPLAGALPMVTPTTSLTTSQPPAKPAATDKPLDLAPKSSLEMIELMKWEMQNRVPDNYNWSVAFHPKKEELSTVSAFLLELGHDVVKEAVYKDIILIQTKKKDQGILKESEVESLEKMKTVYENTKKKVEHLEMKKRTCKPCKFQTESAVVMNHHKDHPHVDPPWDWHGGHLCCALCDFRTKQTAAFSFHMEAVHKAVAKMPEKPGLFPCEMCPLDLSTKNKLLKHRVKCMKTFKLNVNLQPYYHDVNFCMKTCYYKPKKPKPIPAPKKPDPRQVATRQLPNRTAGQVVQGLNQTQVMGIRQTLMQPQFVPRPPHLQRQPVSITPIVRAPPAAFRQAQPQVSKSPVVRQMIQQQKQGGTAGIPPSKEMSGFEVCELCGGYVKDRQALRIHFYYAHKVEMPQTIFNRPTPPLSCDVCESKFWTTQGLSKHKSTLRHYSTAANATKPAPTTHKCFMCSRSVTNLFIHVEQSHGMTMKDLVAMKKCIMCGITAADRKQLEVHMSSLHGVLIKANDFLGTEKPTQPAKTPVPLQPKPATPSAPAAASNKGKSMVRNNLCVFCQIQFADNIQLTMHCIKIHATCSACGMVVASSKHLANHHCKKMMRDCDICGLKKLAPDAYAVHIKKHVKPCSVKIDNMTDKAVKSKKEDIKKNYKPAVISLDSDSGSESDVEVVDDNAKTKNNDKEDVEVLDSGTSPVKDAKKGSNIDSELSGNVPNEDKISNDENEESDEADEEPAKMKDKKSDNDLSADKEQNIDEETSEKVEENEGHKDENETGEEAVESDSDSDESLSASKEVDVDSELHIGNKDESSQDSKNDSKLGTEDESSRDSKSGSDSKISNEDDSSQGSQNEPESDSARNIKENQASRKRKNSDDSDSDESKRLKTESDNMAEDSVNDSESNGAEISDVQEGGSDNVDDNDSAGGIKRSCEEEVQEDAGDDSGTESEQAYKRRKITEETE